MLRIAVAKGRTEKEVLKLFERCGIYFDEHNKTRKLILRDRNEKLELILTKPVDTTVYVETGAADCGIVGKDILLENDADVYSLLSLGIARCKMCVAKKRGDDFQQNKFITVATKFPRIAKKYFDEKNIDCKIIYLSGSVELAPILNIADVIAPCPNRHHAQRKRPRRCRRHHRRRSRLLYCQQSQFKDKICRV